MTDQTFQRMTLQRRVILEELQKLRSHPTAVALHSIVRNRLPKISLGTVYRNLDLLSRMGTINRLDFSGSESRFDGNVQQHDHLRCVQCGRVEDVFGPPLDLLGGGINDWGGYRILGRRLEYLGVCPECRNATEDARNRQISIATNHSVTMLNPGDETISPKPR